MRSSGKLADVSRILRQSGIPDAEKEALTLITETLGITADVFFRDNPHISDGLLREIDARTARRARGEPLQYIAGHVDFLGLRIHVGPGVLIPRPETELLVMETISELKKKRSVRDEPDGSMTSALRLRILDLCTGSGCIAVALARAFPASDVYGIDRSPAALRYATANAASNRTDNVHFLLGDLYEPLGPERFDCITANPPYIRTEDMQKLQREIRHFEPPEALDGGADGLVFFRRLVAGAPGRLRENGMLVMEVGYGQAAEVQEIALGAGFALTEVREDYAGIPRIFVGFAGEI
ncbi:MAG TPA: peptide chain release factor N(5)-glutamine methyltransferase [Dissulfurispiraceae bacterium]|nr:peptide chain release factor N(5)-glutamine methyltransferase [Dissulfurispiraceae bacterium]